MPIIDLFTLYVFAFVLGLCLGSFLHALAWRLYALEKLGARSKCPQCRYPLSLADLVPVFSYLFLGGRCRFCAKPIGALFPVFELLSGLVAILVLRRAGGEFGPHLLFLVVVAAVLLITIASDARFKLIYDIILLPAIVTAFIAALFSGHLATLILGAILGLIFFGLQYKFSDGQAIGLGDVKLGIFLGLVFGWYQLLFVIALAYLAGTVVSIAILIRRTGTMKSALPLGVFLGGAGLYILVFGVSGLERLLGL